MSLNLWMSVPSDAASLSAGPLVLAQEAATLVSWWKALLIVPPVLAWGWLVSAVFDKHAARFYFKQDLWGVAHVSVGVVAVAAALAVPIAAWWGFLIGYAVMLLILGGHVATFVTLANKDDRVPEKHHLKLDLSSFAEAAAAKKQKKTDATVSLQIQGKGGLAAVPAKETPEFELRAAAEALYIRGQDLGASRMEIGPASREAYAATYLVDGVRQPGEQLEPARATAIIDFWKACAGLDVEDRRRRLTGEIKVTRSDIRVPCRLVTSGRQGGMELSLAYDPESRVRRGADDLGLLPKQLELVRTMVDGHGVVLLAAAPRNGRTTTLYSVAQMHDAYTSAVQTVEIEPEAALEGVKQVKFDPTADGPEFSTTVRSILRRDPDVVAVADLPDAETAKEISSVDASRTRVYASVKADSALTAVQLWVKAVGDPKRAAETLNGVVAQKLLRRLCENCKIGFQPSAELVRKLGLPDGSVGQLYKKGGQVLIKNKPETCPVCSGIGYRGQIAAFEVYAIGDEERKLITEQNWSGLRAQMRKAGQPSISSAALRRAVEGATSIEEVMRVTQPAKPKPAAAASASGEAAARPAPVGGGDTP